jgi:hypothetical protein
MQRIVRAEAEILANAGGFSVDPCAQCHLFPDYKNYRNRITLPDYVNNELDERWLREFCNHSGP